SPSISVRTARGLTVLACSRLLVKRSRFVASGAKQNIVSCGSGKSAPPNPTRSASSPSTRAKTFGILGCPHPSRQPLPIAAARSKHPPPHHRRRKSATPSWGSSVVTCHLPSSNLIRVGAFPFSSFPAFSNRVYSADVGVCGLSIFFHAAYELLRSSSILNSSSSALSNDVGNPVTSIFTFLAGPDTSSSL